MLVVCEAEASARTCNLVSGKEHINRGDGVQHRVIHEHGLIIRQTPMKPLQHRPVHDVPSSYFICIWVW
jgi:hypothetical protein